MTQQTSSSLSSRLRGSKEATGTSCLSSVTCQDRWRLASSPVNPLEAGAGPRAHAFQLPLEGASLETRDVRLAPTGGVVGGETVDPGPPTLRWKGLLATRVWQELSGEGLGSISLGKVEVALLLHHGDVSPGAVGCRSPCFSSTSSLHPTPCRPPGPVCGDIQRGAARRRVKSETLGMALATAIPPGEENKGPFLCVGINSKESSGVSFKP